MELGLSPIDDPHAGYLVEEESDLEYSGCSGDSSDDENRATQAGAHADKGSSGDEFEKEMEAEAARIMERTTGGVLTEADLKKLFSPKESKQNETVTIDQSKSRTEEYYNKAYFDTSSSEEEEEEQGSTKNRNSRSKVRKLTNDELFYDPNMDDEDERWVQRQRMSYHNVRVSEKMQRQPSAKGTPRTNQPSSSGKNSGTSIGINNQEFPLIAPLHRSDAVLSCPACLSSLCLDCQRHQLYSNQYRAMFVMNCKIIHDEQLLYVPKPGKKNRSQKRSRQKVEESRAMQDEEEDTRATFNPVRCSSCNTEVAVYDTDEVYHFFNVLASAP